jgi:preprotein translocase subunit SecY
MAWIRYIAYFIAITFVTWSLTQLELSSPGSLKLHLVLSDTDVYGTSELSPVEMIQAIILAACGIIMAWVARYCPSQRPIAFGLGGVALACLIRELDYFLDRYLADNLWQVLVAIVGSLVIVYVYRHRRRLRIALARIWPSPGLSLLYSGAVILFAYSLLVGHEALWMSILGDDYQRVIKLAVEEFIELVGYFLWMIGTIEYAFQARAIAYKELQPAAQKRRQKRRQDAEGRY